MRCLPSHRTLRALTRACVLLLSGALCTVNVWVCYIYMCHTQSMCTVCANSNSNPYPAEANHSLVPPPALFSPSPALPDSIQYWVWKTSTVSSYEFMQRPSMRVCCSSISLCLYCPKVVCFRFWFIFFFVFCASYLFLFYFLSIFIFLLFLLAVWNFWCYPRTFAFAFDSGVFFLESLVSKVIPFRIN